MNFLSQIFFNNIDHGYRAAILKKKYFVAASVSYGCGTTYFYYEKVLDPYSGRLVENITITFSPDFQSVFNKKTFMLYFGQTELYSSLLERFTGI